MFSKRGEETDDIKCPFAFDQNQVPFIRNPIRLLGDVNLWYLVSLG